MISKKLLLCQIKRQETQTQRPTGPIVLDSVIEKRRLIQLQPVQRHQIVCGKKNTQRERDRRAMWPTHMSVILFNSAPGVLFNKGFHQAPWLLPVADVRGNPAQWKNKHNQLTCRKFILWILSLKNRPDLSFFSTCGKPGSFLNPGHCVSNYSRIKASYYEMIWNCWREVNNILKGKAAYKYRNPYYVWWKADREPC